MLVQDLFRCCSPQMDERELRVEQELIADLRMLAADICSDLMTSPRLSIWGQRRGQIAEMRQRIRTGLRARHLGKQPRAR
jgi:hypothetical protein